MTEFAIDVHDLGKQYHIGGLKTQQSYKTLRESIVNTVNAPFRRVRKLLRGQATGAAELDEAFWALQGLNFQVKHGEVVGIIGRNGAGKSTLLKILSQITDPTIGYVDMYGRVGALLEVGTGFHQELTGRENIYLNGTILGMTRREIDAKFDEIVAFAEIEQFIETPVKHYSNGMRLRLGFAIAAHLEPEILIIDEVLSVGDVSFQRKCIGKMGEVANAGRTVLVVSHHMHTIQSLCTRVIVLEEGQIIFDGATDQGIEVYLARYQESEQTSLAERRDRQGNGKAIFTDVRFLHGETQQEITTLLSGQEVHIQLHFRNQIAETLHNIKFSIGFTSSMGQFLFTCNSEATDELIAISASQADGFVTCTIPKWPLKNGLLSYNILMSENGINLDWVQEAGRIESQVGDYYGTGVIPARGRSEGFFIDYGWTQDQLVKL